MEDKIREIIGIYCDKIKTDANTESIARSVKSIDTIVQKMYLELYGLKDIRHNSIKSESSEKKGHCC